MRSAIIKCENIVPFGNFGVIAQTLNSRYYLVLPDQSGKSHRNENQVFFLSAHAKGRFAFGEFQF